MKSAKAAIYSDAHGSSEVEGFMVFSVEEKRVARVIASPIETGQQSFDNKVIDPKRIIVKGVISPYIEGSYQAKEEITEMYENREFEFYSVTGTNTSYDNLILESVSAVQDASEPDLWRYELTYVEALFISSSSANGKSASTSSDQNSDFRNTGYQAGA